jgi:succinate-acetate transporter protein
MLSPCPKPNEFSELTKRPPPSLYSLLGSLRTNVTFVILFTVLDVAFYLLAAAYFRLGEGGDASKILIAAGVFGFLTTLCGWWIMLALILGSTGMPFTVPLGDLSGFLARK